MIEKIEFDNIAQSQAYGYAEKLDFFKNNQSIEFKPGLNIIFAPNGTGKSTILEILAKFTASEQGGVSTITSTWMQDMFRYGESTMKGIKVFHDGQPTLYNNPRKAVGLFGGMAAFDDDFLTQGLMETQLKESTGYTTITRLQKVLGVLAGKEEMPQNFDKKVHKIDEKYNQFLGATIEKGQQTMILDEPESGLAIHVQSNIFRMLQKQAKENKIQIIIATHSPFALTCNANFIELQPGYIKIAKQEIELLGEILKLQEELKKAPVVTKSEEPIESSVTQTATSNKAKKKPK